MFSYAQVWLMVQEAVVLAAFVLFVFRLRSEYGLSLLYLLLGGFQYIQAVLILSVYVEILPNFVVSPGSAVLFTATLFTVLLVYVREDGIEARKLIFGVALANIALSLLTIMIAGHLRSGSVHNLYHLSGELFVQIPRILVLSTLVLILDVTCILEIYRRLGKWLGRYQLLRIFVSMLMVSMFDGILFTTACFVTHDSYREILFSALLSKAAATALYAPLLSGYLRLMDSDRINAPVWQARLVDVLSVSRYRSKYEALKREFVRDPLTRVFSRGYFDDVVQREVARSVRLSVTMSVLMLDLDHFKQVNDTYGHAEGDRVLRSVGTFLLSAVRSFDIPCRYGGEEFFVILPGTDGTVALAIAQRLREGLLQLSAKQHPDPLPCRVTVTIGVASVPGDAEDCDELLMVADKRLYQGKKAGRNCVVGAPEA